MVLRLLLWITLAITVLLLRVSAKRAEIIEKFLKTFKFYFNCCFLFIISLINHSIDIRIAIRYPRSFNQLSCQEKSISMMFEDFQFRVESATLKQINP